MNFILRWLRRLSASDTAVRAVEQSLLDWKHEVDEAPGVLGAFASDFRMAAGLARLIVSVILLDIRDAFRGGWWRRLLLWNIALMPVLFFAFGGSLHPTALENVVGLFVGALPYTVTLLIARERKSVPAIGLFVITAGLAAAGFTAFRALSPWPRSWFTFGEWLLLPVLCILLADRLRREARPYLQLVWCALAWVAARALQLQLLTYAGGVYRPWIAWVSVATPAALWLYFVWKQERSIRTADVEEVHA